MASKTHQQSTAKPRLVLLGCGHAHLFFVEAITHKAVDAVDIILIEPNDLLYYSGILPSVLVGHMSNDFLTISLARLVKNTPINWIKAHATTIDAHNKKVTLSSGESIGYDWLSINTGAQAYNPWQESYGQSSHLLSVKPIPAFVNVQTQLTQTNTQGKKIVIIGGGFAGVEIAAAFKHRFTDSQVTIVSSRLLAEANTDNKLVTVVQKKLDRLGIVHIPDRVAKVTTDDKGMSLTLYSTSNTLENNPNSHNRLHADFVFVAMGAVAPDWLQTCQLAKDSNGFLLVNDCHQSVSHPDVFVTGDVCAREDIQLPKAGVYAVRAGEVLAQNLLALLKKYGENKNTSVTFSAYQPSKNVLQILALGDKYAVASYGKNVVAGRWVWYLKKYIDITFIKRFSR